MMICVDCGNSNIRLALVDENLEVEHILKIKNAGEFSARQICDAVYSSNNANLMKTDLAVVSSVTPERDKFLYDALYELSGSPPIFVNSSLDLPISLNYDDPSSLGADRIANAVAVSIIYPGKNSIVVDAGTAVTFCVILDGGIFDGGLIAPGAGISAEALYQKTSKLPDVKLRKPGDVVARNTADGIASGLYYGWKGMINGIICEIERKYRLDFNVIITGGAGEVLACEIGNSVFEKDLMMKGMYFIGERCRRSRVSENDDLFFV